MIETSSLEDIFVEVLVLATRTFAIRSTLIPETSQSPLNLSAISADICSSSARVRVRIQKRALVSLKNQLFRP